MMKSEIPAKIVFFVLIAERTKKDALLTMLSASGGRVMNTIYGKGSVKASTFLEAFGLIPEENKIIITCLITKEKADIIFDILTDKFKFDKPNTGIAFTIPVEGLLY